MSTLTGGRAVAAALTGLEPVAGASVHLFGESAEVALAAESVTRVASESPYVGTARELLNLVFGVNSTALGLTGTMNATLGEESE